MSETKQSKPPLDISGILAVFMSEQNLESFIGDLEERYSLIFECEGRRSATVWYCGEIIRSLLSLSFESLKRLSGFEKLVVAPAYSPIRTGIMKYEIAYCDVHQTSAMVPVTIGLLAGMGDHNTLNADRCGLPGCTRHYEPDFGYFTSVIGEKLEIGDVAQKRRCSNGHEPKALILARVGGLLVWTCPSAGCEYMEPVDGGGKNVA